MGPEKFFLLQEFSLPQKEKNTLLLKALNHLTLMHKIQCPEYAKILHALYPSFDKGSAMEELPYLPVTLFKEIDLLSIPREKVFKTLLSSGTTGSIPSRIFLDQETARRQTKALGSIMTSLLGNKRLPMLIIDNEDVIKNRRLFSARGAGILGMMNFGRNHLYALDAGMNLKKEVYPWLEKYREEQTLIFGFTFLIWQYFLQQIRTSLPGSVLIHSGGWKKLKDQAVTNERFKEIVKEKTAIEKTFSFYGMVEQVGSVFLECKYGYMHCPNFADIIIRDHSNWRPAKKLQKGVIQVLSPLATSYPGHSLLTEDWGRIIDIDNCPCGRKGKFFQIEGRVDRAESRGCGDTFRGVE